MKIKELFEASKPGRAWSGKIKNIDELLSWMYDKDILTKGDKAKKDSIFHQYYRYYNDGDLPKSLALKGFSKFSNELSIETALEKYIEDFIKDILAKYMSKVDRGEFRLDKMLSDLDTVTRISSDYDAYGLLNYWIKKVKIKEDSALKELVEKLKTQYDALYSAVNAVDEESDNMTMSYRRTSLQKDKKWNKDLEKGWKEVCSTMDQITEFLENLTSSVKRIKKEKLRNMEEK